MLEPLAVDPNRSVAPAANSMASAKLVFPAPAGPTSAITRVPLDGCPTMRLSLRAVAGARVALKRGAPAPFRKRPPSACFARLARGLVSAPGESVAGTVGGKAMLSGEWSIARDIRQLRRRKC